MLSVARLASSQTWRRVRPQQAGLATRGFRACSAAAGWENQTQDGSETEVFVYKPEFDIYYPDTKFGPVARKDPNFSLPGNTGLGHLGLESLQLPAPRPDTVHSATRTNKDNQLYALYNANDFIRYTQDSQKDTLHQEGVIAEEFPELPGQEDMDLQVHVAPTLLRQTFCQMWPQEDLQYGSLSVLTITLHADHDMSTWSPEVEEEREKLTEHSVIACQELCGRLKDDGYWADFIDPCSGTPHFDKAHTNVTMFETDEKFRLLGFDIQDLGCCKVVSHTKFGRHCMVACIVTNAAAGSDALENIMEEFNPSWLLW